MLKSPVLAGSQPEVTDSISRENHSEVEDMGKVGHDIENVELADRERAMFFAMDPPKHDRLKPAWLDVRLGLL